MKLNDHYRGSEDPFEGDRTLWLRSLPSGARVTGARVTLKSARAAFTEDISFDENGVGDWGATRSPALLDAATFQAVAELHARRTATQIVASGESANRPVTVQMNLGGTWVSLADDGSILAPERQPLILRLPATVAATALSLPSVTSDKIQLTAIDANNRVDPNGKVRIHGLTISSVPSNVSLRFGARPPFWMHLGELSGAQTSPDFALILNAFLSEAWVQDGFYAIPLVIHSDTIARLDVEVNIEYTIVQPILPAHLPEVTLTYGYSSLPGVALDLLSANLPSGAEIISASGRVQGTFDASRVAYGKIGESQATTVVAVTSNRTLAQPILLDQETPASFIDLPLANTEPGLASLKLILQSDADGTPSGEVLISADVTVDRPVPGSSAWGSSALPFRFRFLPKRRYWLILQILSGEDQAFWDATVADQSAPALMASGDGGFSWRTAATDKGEKPLQAIFRLRHVPDHFSVPVELQIGRRADARRVRFDRFAPLGRVEFDIDFTAELNEHLAAPTGTAACGKGELLINGSFEQPLPDDATRKLFGFDAPRFESTSLKGDVNLEQGADLSIQRYIVLSVDNGRPLRIDCAGDVPERTRREEIVEAINMAMGIPVAGYNGGLIITSPASGGVELHAWCRRQAPHGWQLKAGHIIRIRFRESLYAVLFAPSSLLGDSGLICPDGSVLGTDPQEQALLAQRIQVSGGCSYTLSFLYTAPGRSEMGRAPGLMIAAMLREASSSAFGSPCWEVLWKDGQGQIIRRDGEKLDLFRSLDRIHLTAPLGAAQAEVRFVQPSPGALFLRRVSFIPTTEEIINPTLDLWKAELVAGQVSSPLGWTVRSGIVEPNSNGAILRGSSNLPDDTVLAQMVGAEENKSYELRVHARPLTVISDDSLQRARLQLRWTAGQEVIGEPVILLLDGRDFRAHSWRGTAPAGTDQVEIQIIQPRGSGDIMVERVSLRHADMLTVPLIFLSEARGELTVSDLQAVYELPEAPEPLSLPSAEIASGRRLMMASPRSLESAVGPGSAVSSRSPLADLDIRLVNGISDRVAHTLTGMAIPITTISQLSALDPEMRIADQSRERRLILKAAAEIIMSIDFQAKPFSFLSKESLDTLLSLGPAEVAEKAGQTVLQAEQLQRNLRSLKLLLKSDAFRKLRLSDLMPR